MIGQGKHIRLFGTIFLSLLGFLAGIALLLFLFRWLMVGMDQFRWFNHVYMVLMLLLPSLILGSAFTLFFIRTRHHPSAGIRLVSRILCSLALLYALFVVFHDLWFFYQHRYAEINRYLSFGLLFLVSEVALLFFVGVLQALTTGKEKDWMERARDRTSG